MSNPLLDIVLTCCEMDEGMLLHLEYWELFEAPELESAEWVLALIEEHPGIWISAICRAMHGIPETYAGVGCCSLCQEYANPRKRARAEFHANNTLPGIEPAYQLHPRCSRHGLTWLRHAIDRLPVERRREQIPDSRQARGWDWGSRCYISHNRPQQKCSPPE